MNIDLLTKTAEALEQTPLNLPYGVGFDMKRAYSRQDHTVCIAGLICLINGCEPTRAACIHARKIAELDDTQARMLFIILSHQLHYEDITPIMAAKAIRSLIATGTVTWIE